jgi:type IX secretion system PorP/SprF family membrane protein
MKKHIITFTLIMATIAGKAQLATSLAQYFANPLIYNPGYAGAHDFLILNLNFRQQWVGITGAPSLINLSGHSPLKREQHALGFVLQREQFGAFTGLVGYANYAHKINLGNSILGLGFQVGFLNQITDWTKIEHIVNPNDPTLRPNESRTEKNSFDFNLGAFYYTSKFYLGLSSKHLAQPIFNSKADTISRTRSQNFLLAGYHFDITTDWTLRPEMLIRYVQTLETALNIGIRAAYQDRFFVGTNYQTGQNSLGFTGKIALTPRFIVGYTYNTYLGTIRTSQNGSHEISISLHSKEINRTNTHKMIHCPY